MQNRCPNCMELIEDGNKCPHCGYDIENNDDSAAGTIIKGRYYLGRTYSYDGVSTVYIGYDNELAAKVFVRKFCGDGVLDNDNIPLGKKSMVERYLNYGKSIAALNMCDILPRTIDVLEEDEAGYIVTDYFEGKTLKDIMASGIRVSEGNAYKIAGKLCDGLKIMHDSHMIFGNLCPSTLYILKDGGIRLFGIGSPFFDFVDDIDILAQVLNPSYAAPELFEEGEQIGPFCDVYSISAILYRLLTNIIPPVSFLRYGGETLIKPIKANPEIEKTVSIALLNGLNLQIEKRTFNTEMFLNELDDPHVRRRKSAYDTKAAILGAFGQNDEQDLTGESSKKRMPGGIVLFFIISLLLIIGIVILLILIIPDDEAEGNPSSDTSGGATASNSDDGWYSENGGNNNSNISIDYESSSRPSSVTNDSSVPDSELPQNIAECPNCLGETLDSATEKLKAAGLEVGMITYEYSTEYTKGYVMSQNVAPGGKAVKGSKVSLVISNGYPPDTTAEMPDVVGKEMFEAIGALKDAGFKNITVNFVSGFDTNGAVTASSHAVFSMVSTDEVITLTVNAKEYTVPDFTNKTYAEVLNMQEVASGKIKVNTVNEEGSNLTPGEGMEKHLKVTAQSFPSGTKGYEGMTVNITVVF